MASTYQRRQQWWIKFQHPGTKEIIRESLETSDRSRAALLCRKIELEVALLDPRYQDVPVPGRVLDKIGRPRPDIIATPSPPALPPSAIVTSPLLAASASPKPRVTIAEAARCFLQYIADENAPETMANKISMLRRFLGPERAEAVLGPSQSAKRFGKHRPRSGSDADVSFQGSYLDEVTAKVVQDFIERLGVSKKTKRHYREFFHKFFEVCMSFELYQPTNFHRPNPIAALPSYNERNRRIIYLEDEEIAKQLAALTEYPPIQMAVTIMIHAGLRRSEVLWLDRKSIAKDLKSIKVLNRYDEESGEESSNKTDERAVIILPPLRDALERYLPSLKSKWLIPTPDGRRWSKDGFSRRLSILNRMHRLPWTCNHYRHTYATQRAAEGWPLFWIAREMGNSVEIVDQYYAAYVSPHHAGAIQTPPIPVTSPQSAAAPPTPQP